MAQKTTAYRPTPTNPNVAVTPRPASSAIEDLDDFMDEIDGLLEENVLEVLRSYQQRGGQ